MWIILSQGGIRNTAREVNTLRPRQNGRHFPDDIFKYILLYKNVWISVKISLKFVRKGAADNNRTLVQIWYVINLTMIGSHNGLTPIRRKAISWTHHG